MKMTVRHKNFILKKLIPFILREQGRGFAMDRWLGKYEPDEEVCLDNVWRETPVCGTICCIGGSIQHLKNIKGLGSKVAEAGAMIGLDYEATEGLFYYWTDENKDFGYGWPAKYRDRYKKASTPYRKARVAAALLREVVRTSGECLKIKR